MKALLYFLIFFCIACSNKTNSDNGTKPLEENTTHLQNADLAPFYHGVASGDPFQNSVVIWTRVTPETRVATIDAKWEVASDSEFSNVLQSGQSSTSPEKDYTIKVIVDGLEPGTSYYYRFQSLDKYSKIGKTKTLPQSDESPIDLAFVSCSNVEFGYFNAYAALAQENVDAVIHLGDYIYEYGPGTYGDTAFYRKNIPPREILSLQDYRDRYSQYRLDEDLQNVHGSAPFINIWDDHEITNNAYVSGAENHQEDEGSYENRKDIAKQVFYEWLPIREGSSHYRKFKFGDMIELIMLDERLAGRTMQPDSLNDPRRLAPDHHLLGDEQMQWLEASLTNSTATWKIIGNQVIFSYSDWGYEGFAQNMDAWDGYPNDQKQVTKIINDNKIDGLVFVTGDTHTAWAFEATNNPFSNYNRETGDGAIGIEFGVTSITSANANERFPTEFVLEHEKKIVNTDINPHLKYVNMRDHGYLRLNIDSEAIIAEYKIVPTIKEKSAQAIVDKVFHVEHGTNKLRAK